MTKGLDLSIQHNFLVEESIVWHDGIYNLMTANARYKSDFYKNSQGTNPSLP